MQTARLERIHITVSDARCTASWLCRVFGWAVRWEGGDLDGSHTVYARTRAGAGAGIGASDLALHSVGHPTAGHSRANAGPTRQGTASTGGLSRIAVVVEDLDAMEHRVKAEGFTTYDHGADMRGRRFYFRDGDGIEYEVVSYLTQKEAFKRQVARRLSDMAKFGILSK